MVNDGSTWRRYDADRVPTRSARHGRDTHQVHDLDTPYDLNEPIDQKNEAPSLPTPPLMTLILLIIILIVLLALLYLCGNGMGLESVPTIIKLIGFVVSLIVILLVILQAAGVAVA